MLLRVLWCKPALMTLDTDQSNQVNLPNLTETAFKMLIKYRRPSMGELGGMAGTKSAVLRRDSKITVMHTRQSVHLLRRGRIGIPSSSYSKLRRQTQHQDCH